MISLLYGDNDFELKKALKKIIKDFNNEYSVEKIDGDSIEANDLPDLLSGISLFSSKRLIVIYDVSTNKEVWEKLADYIDGDNSSSELLLVESSPDKRTRTFKLLQKQSLVHEYKKLNEGEAKKWLLDQAKVMKVEISLVLADKIIERAGTDQWKLHYGLQKLALLGDINEQKIIDNIEASPQANVFALIDASLHRSPEKAHRLVQLASVSEDPYFFFGLLSSQIFQLVTLASSEKSPSEVASDLGVHPYPLQKLSGLAKQVNKSQMQKIANIIAECDDKLKRSGAEPWLLIEQALIKLANR
jgi:DNA polymerase III delta subunit